MFALPLGILFSTIAGLIFIGIAIAWRAAKFVILVAGTTYMLTTLILIEARANVPMAQIPEPAAEWGGNPYAVLEDDFVHRSHPYLYMVTFYELTVITKERFIDYEHVFMSLDACLASGWASRKFEEDYLGFICEEEQPDPDRVRTVP